MQSSVCADLGKAIDRLLECCHVFDRDRTSLAHALKKTQASYADLEKRCRQLESRQEEVASRLESVLQTIAAVFPDIELASKSEKEEYANTPESIPLAWTNAKTFDWKSVERITRLSPKHTEPVYIAAQETLPKPRREWVPQEDIIPRKDAVPQSPAICAGGAGTSHMDVWIDESDAPAVVTHAEETKIEAKVEVESEQATQAAEAVDAELSLQGMLF